MYVNQSISIYAQGGGASVAEETEGTHGQGTATEGIAIILLLSAAIIIPLVIAPGKQEVSGVARRAPGAFQSTTKSKPAGKMVRFTQMKRKTRKSAL